ncbi:MAG: hypothetical protein JRD04_11985, partial [Deltaproteobacteria bacterium]|nr:hypothetical protein [Deltaproteobacteria bacterium]
MISGRVVGLDAFGKPGTFPNVFKKLLEIYALDAIDWHDPDKEYKALKSEVAKSRKAAQAAEAESHRSVVWVPTSVWNPGKRPVLRWSSMNRLSMSMSPFFSGQTTKTEMEPIQKSRGFQQGDGIEGP